MQNPIQRPSDETSDEASHQAAMQAVRIEPQPTPARLEELGVLQWPIWTKEISEFPWTYDELETCYLLEGEVIVTPTHSAPVQIGKGNLVTFPAGMSCTWQVLQPVKKHYQFG